MLVSCMIYTLLISTTIRRYQAYTPRTVSWQCFVLFCLGQPGTTPADTIPYIHLVLVLDLAHSVTVSALERCGSDILAVISSS